MLFQRQGKAPSTGGGRSVDPPDEDDGGQKMYNDMFMALSKYAADTLKVRAEPKKCYVTTLGETAEDTLRDDKGSFFMFQPATVLIEFAKELSSQRLDAAGASAMLAGLRQDITVRAAAMITDQRLQILEAVWAGPRPWPTGWTVDSAGDLLTKDAITDGDLVRVSEEKDSSAWSSCPCSCTMPTRTTLWHLI
jgi:hypothetical protein